MPTAKKDDTVTEYDPTVPGDIAPEEVDAEPVNMIVHRTNYVDNNGVQQTKEHGPMPIADWPAYAKKNGF